MTREARLRSGRVPDRVQNGPATSEESPRTTKPYPTLSRSPQMLESSGLSIVSGDNCGQTPNHSLANVFTAEMLK